MARTSTTHERIPNSITHLNRVPEYDRCFKPNESVGHAASSEVDRAAIDRPDCYRTHAKRVQNARSVA